MIQEAEPWSKESWSVTLLGVLMPRKKRSMRSERAEGVNVGERCKFDGAEN